MTKAQLLAALADLPMDSKVLVASMSRTNNMDALLARINCERELDPNHTGDLASVADVAIYEDDGPGAPAFAVIEHSLQYGD